MSLISFKSVITLCSVSVLAAACAPRAHYGQQAQRSNLPLYTSASSQMQPQIQSTPLSGQPQTIEAAQPSASQLSYNASGVMAPIVQNQPEPTYSMLTTPTQNPNYNHSAQPTMLAPIQTQAAAPMQAMSLQTAPLQASAAPLQAQPQFQPIVSPIQTAQPSVTAPAPRATFGYTIQKGDTLFGIGRRFNVHPQDIANHNSMMNPHNLKIGQSITIPSSGRQYTPDTTVGQAQTGSVMGSNNTLLSAVRANRVTTDTNSVKYFKMPQQGRIVQNYDGKEATGVRIMVPNNTALRAASEGEVIYVGSVDGYGKMVLIRHADGYVSNYAGLNKIYVSQGQKLNAGDMIANASKQGASMAEVLFELRQGTKTINPHAFIG